MRGAVVEAIGRLREMQLETAVRGFYWSLLITGVLCPVMIGTITSLTYSNTQPNPPYLNSAFIPAACCSEVFELVGQFGRGLTSANRA